MCRGTFDLGRPVLEKELAETHASEDARLRCRGLVAAAFLSYFAGRYEDTCRYGEGAISVAKELGDVALAADATDISGSGYLGGDHAAARRHFDEGLALARQTNNRVLICDALIMVGELESTEGNLERAEEFYEAALASAREQRSRVFTLISLMNLARISISRGSIAPAVELLREALTLADEAQSTRQAPHLLRLGAALAARRGDPARAARFHGASKRQLEEMLLRQEPADEHALAPLLAEAQGTVKPAEWASAEAAGFALRCEDALAELRAWLAQLA